MNENLILIILGVSGVLFHCLIKAKSLRDSSISANVKFTFWKSYVKSDYLAILIALVSVFIWYFCNGEVSKKYSIVTDWRRVTFVLWGICGSWIIQAAADTFTNSAKKKIQKMVDVKTNVSDAITGPAKTVDEIVEKASEAGINAKMPPKENE